MRFLDRTDLFNKHKNKWLALTEDDKVISSGSTLEKVLKIAKKKGFDNPITAKIPDPSLEFIL